MNINLESYRVFYYVAKLGSFSQAAQQLCISQPAVSQSIKQLEEQLGGVLFSRMPRGVQLTSEGAVLFSYISQGYEYFMRAEKKFREMQQLEAGEVRIGASDMTMQFYLLPHLEEFHRQYPKVRIQVSNAPTPVTLKSLHNGSIDFGIISGPVSDADEFRMIPVGELQDIFVAGERFSHMKEQIYTPQQLSQLPVIMLEHGTTTRRYIDRYFSDRGLTLEPELELATSDLIVKLAARGMGIGCVVEGFARRSIDSGTLFPLKLQEPIPKRQMLLAVHKKLMMSAAGTQFIRLMGIAL